MKDFHISKALCEKYQNFPYLIPYVMTRVLFYVSTIISK